jgi:hypothetical protein
MSFTLANWGRVDVGLNNTFTVNNSSGAGTAEGNEGLFQYNGYLAGDDIATITAANYFVPVVGYLQLNSIIFVSGTDADGIYVVSSITYPEITGTAGAVSVSSYGPSGSIGTANIENNAVTYAKIQEAGEYTLIGNPTGSTANVEEITLGNGLQFNGTVLQVPLSNGNYVTGTVTAAQFKALYATPLQLVEDAGAHTVLVATRLVLETVYGTTQYAAGGAVGLQYSSTTEAGGAPASATIAAATINGYTGNSIIEVAGLLGSEGYSAVVNAGLFLNCATQAFTTGDSTFVYHLWYDVITTTI